MPRNGTIQMYIPHRKKKTYINVTYSAYAWKPYRKQRQAKLTLSLLHMSLGIRKHIK